MFKKIRPSLKNKEYLAIKNHFEEVENLVIDIHATIYATKNINDVVDFLGKDKYDFENLKAKKAFVMDMINRLFDLHYDKDSKTYYRVDSVLPLGKEFRTHRYNHKVTEL